MTLHVSIGFAFYACPHLMHQPDSVVPVDVVVIPTPTRVAPPTLCGEGQLVAPLSPPADEQCLYHCLAAAPDVIFYESVPLPDKSTAVYCVKAEFLEFARAKGTQDVAARLSGKGPDSYPDIEDFNLLGEVLGGQIVLHGPQVGGAGPIYYNSGCPQILVLGHLMVKDGSGHRAPHL